ncbi:MAG: 3D domain-containing protein [Chloroflexota bacterium]
MRSALNVALLIAFVGIGSFSSATSIARAADELQQGSIATVVGTDGSGLRVRLAPGITNRVVGTIREGQRLDILDGPVHSGGLDWYQIKLDALTGWSNAKYLVPVDRAPKSASPYMSELVAPMPEVPAGARALISKTTGYATGNPGVGTRTATGTTVRWGTVSVDPGVIPFGSQLLIDGFDGTVFTAEDRGSGVKGTHVDIFFPEPAAASKYGTQQRRITVIREGYGR